MGGDATSVADLNLKPSQLFVGAASRDIVTIAPRFLGTDPTIDSVGAIRFGAESPDRGWMFDVSDHSLYYDDSNNSESLHSMADIVTGHADRLGQEGLLVDNRDTGLVTTLVDTLADLLPGNPLGLGPFPNGAYDPEFIRTPQIIPDHAPVAGVPRP
jgi:hypothetical protein